MYIPGRSRTGSRPLSTVMSFAPYATRAAPLVDRYVGVLAGPRSLGALLAGQLAIRPAEKPLDKSPIRLVTTPD